MINLMNINVLHRRRKIEVKCQQNIGNIKVIKRCSDELNILNFSRAYMIEL